MVFYFHKRSIVIALEIKVITITISHKTKTSDMPTLAVLVRDKT